MFSFFKKKPSSIKELWDQIKTWLNKHAPHLINELKSAATRQDIIELETLVGANLPEDYVQFIMMHNGQNRESEGIIDTEEVLSIERIIDEWKVWKDLLDSGEFNDYKSKPSKGVKDDWWNSKWIPITYDGSGNHYCLDLDPAAGGKVGQVIRMWHDDSERKLMSSSFLEWMADYVTALKKGKFVYSEEWGGIISKDHI